MDSGLHGILRQLLWFLGSSEQTPVCVDSVLLRGAGSAPVRAQFTQEDFRSHRADVSELLEFCRQLTWSLRLGDEVGHIPISALEFIGDLEKLRGRRKVITHVVCLV